MSSIMDGSFVTSAIQTMRLAAASEQRGQIESGHAAKVKALEDELVVALEVLDASRAAAVTNLQAW